ncbi:MAG: RNA-binding S4 domain-containing protein [Firmicutes bacterium]|nr:RNA-binding S4 domain-containing protein [Bacillota bacterium]
MKTATISTPSIKLDALLKYAGFCGTGGEAKTVIQGGRVLVNGAVCVQRGKKIIPGDRVSLGGEEITVGAAPMEPPAGNP